ncbi:type III PLP-dependent enzyme [Actinacidiphila sp. ITFR-21]|uniref:type III PLP-dependent enzyme n=1 Tax=Actinacidiphila sp. ITFR-21 TaxID=3075199 RepID=UPI00288C011B|nr:type III PLP-dependent enzyme [Streptomyces sp. ITFR-21]WNI18973.1 type III PLP-dependent enzyme [Streptomyces sp. ITFR-21]
MTARVRPTGAVRDLALSLPTGQLPAYIYDLDALREHAAAVRAALPERVELYYAAKANPEPRILAALAPFVDGYEVASGGELAHVAGAVPGRPVAFGGPGKTPAEITAALAAGVRRFHVESEHELRTLAWLAAGAGVRAGVLLRFNLAVRTGALTAGGLAMGGRPTPFGIDPLRADAAVAALTDGSCPQVELLGVHAHLASGLAAPELLAVAGSVVGWAAALAARHRVALREVNVGGGMHVDYADPAARFDWAAYGAGLARLTAAHPGLLLRVEPGRALTAYCGWYATDVLDVKRSHGEEFAVVRGGTHHLRTPAAKGHDQPCAVLPVADWPHPWPRPAGGAGPVTLAGQLCTPKDVLARRVPAPGLRAGDRVVFALAGAYAWNISHHDFLMHPRPTAHFSGGSGAAPAPPAAAGGNVTEGVRA